ncbi:Hypothetical predicted protein [Lecanosticta acicola]|uniref:Uncharacterized protein n=1 Tax=Lecanosticta acicola TaxID=111012 RepID=A0AAI8YRC4_9PEZI|nr:Hypothetical predicted protein [Lecanosticta acicola]
MSGFGVLYQWPFSAYSYMQCDPDTLDASLTGLTGDSNWRANRAGGSFGVWSPLTGAQFPWAYSQAVSYPSQAVAQPQAVSYSPRALYGSYGVLDASTGRYRNVG